MYIISCIAAAIWSVLSLYMGRSMFLDGRAYYRTLRGRWQKERERAILASTTYIYRSAPPMREKS